MYGKQLKDFVGGIFGVCSSFSKGFSFFVFGRLA